MTSKDELREKLLEKGAVFIADSVSIMFDDILNLLEGEIAKAQHNCNVEVDQPNDVHIGYFNQGYKKGYKDAEEDCTAIWTAKLATLNKEPNKGEDVDES